MSERLAYRVSEVADRTGMSKGTVYRAVRTGQIPHVVINGTVLIPAAALHELLGQPVVAE